MSESNPTSKLRIKGVIYSIKDAIARALIGDLSELTTTAKDNLVEAINEAAQTGGGGTSDYNSLINKPQINDVTLSGNKSLHDLGIAAESDIPSVPQPYNSNPAALGTPSPGSSNEFSRGDHSHAKPTYSKSDIGLGNVDNVQQYSATNPPPYPVTSVNGSTGAVTLDADDVGAMSKVLVWTNASPSSNFAAQTVPVDLSGYDYILIETNTGVRILAIGSDYREYCFQPYGGANMGYRSVYATTTGVTFDDFYKLGTYGTFSSRTQDNSQAKPIKIYGMKGAQ